MIAQLAITVICVVAAWSLASLIKGGPWFWYWSWTSCSWRLTSPGLRQSSRPRLMGTFSSRCTAQPLHQEHKCSELNEVDLKVLISHIEETDGGPPWKLMMEHSTPTLTYQAWFRDPPLGGPTQHRTRTVFENVSPELLRDFFWDDEFRPSWDNMLIYFQTLSVCPQTGTMTVHWIRKLPLFCSNREYVITRRILQSASGYYCLTKGIPYPSLPMTKRSRRVDNYYSSWHIRSVKPKDGGQQSASEVIMFHHEDIGLPRDVVKMAVRARMWGMVKRLHRGVQNYSMAKAKYDGSPSIYALMANTTAGSLHPQRKYWHQVHKLMQIRVIRQTTRCLNGRTIKAYTQRLV